MIWKRNAIANGAVFQVRSVEIIAITNFGYES
jgi:hypothetical protein